MAQEEEIQKPSNNNIDGGGFNMGNTGRSCKKQKQKKVPQRGLGVAQLEKIRIEEQQKKYVSEILPSPPAVSPTRPSNISVPLPIYQSYSLSTAHPPDVSSPDSRIKPQNSDVVSPNTIPLVNSIGLGWQSVPAPKMLNSCPYTLERESFGVDTGLRFQSSSNFVCESNPIYPLPSLLQKPKRHQQPSPSSSSSSSSMVNVSSLSNSPSTLSFQMEPPSNQSYYGMYTSTWEEEEKIVGMKRSYPFSVDNSPAPFLHCKKLPPIAHPIGRSDDQSCSFGIGGALNFISGNSNSREEPSGSCSIMESHSKRGQATKTFGNSNDGDFLTLVSPTINLTCQSSKLNRPSAYLAFNNHDTIDLSSLPYQGNMGDPIHQPAPSIPNPRQPYYSFLPKTKMQTGQATKTFGKTFGNSNDGEVGEDVDLNLKL